MVIARVSGLLVIYCVMLYVLLLFLFGCCWFEVLRQFDGCWLSLVIVVVRGFALASVAVYAFVAVFRCLLLVLWCVFVVVLYSLCVCFSFRCDGWLLCCCVLSFVRSCCSLALFLLLYWFVVIVVVSSRFLCRWLELFVVVVDVKCGC